MTLRGKKPETHAKRFKGLFIGAAGVGKTMASIQFPKPYLIDTERGAENDSYVELLNAGGGALFQTTDFEELVQEVKALLSTKHEYRTLIIDPITTVYDDLIEQAEIKVGTDFGRHYGEAKKRWKRLSNLISRLDMNVIITSHEKNMYGDSMAVIGKTYDGPKGMDYLFDFVFEICKRGEERVGVVKKTRMGDPGQFPESEVFPFSYDEIAERYGRDVLERQAVAVELASEGQVSMISSILPESGVSSEAVEKWLGKNKAADFTEVSSANASKFIEYLESQISAKKARV